MKSKSDTFQCFKLFFAMFEKPWKHSIITLCSKNGVEYLLKEFTNHLALVRIKHEPGPPHSPESKRVAERTNPTLKNLIKCALLSANLPKTFWADTLFYVIHPVNSIPMKTPLGFKSSNSILDLPCFHAENLQPFECSSWYKVPEANRNKLDPKARMAILLSYLFDGNVYCLYNLRNKSVIKLQYVVFDHQLFPYGQAIQKSSEPIIVKIPWPVHKSPKICIPPV